jgi:hypothetical protein
MPSLIMGIPRNWFLLSVGFYLVPYNFGSPFIGILLYLSSLLMGFMLSKYFDPDFADIIIEKLKYVSFGFSKIVND